MLTARSRHGQQVAGVRHSRGSACAETCEQDNVPASGGADGVGRCGCGAAWCARGGSRAFVGEKWSSMITVPLMTGSPGAGTTGRGPARRTVTGTELLVSKNRSSMVIAAGRCDDEGAGCATGWVGVDESLPRRLRLPRERRRPLVPLVPLRRCAGGCVASAASGGVLDCSLCMMNSGLAQRGSTGCVCVWMSACDSQWARSWSKADTWERGCTAHES